MNIIGADEMQRHNDTEGSRFTIGDDEDEDEMDEEDEAVSFNICIQLHTSTCLHKK